MKQNLLNLLKKHADKVRFVLVGGTNTVIDFAILFSLVNLVKMPVFYSNIISTSVALSFSFFANKKFTFKDKTAAGKDQLSKFLVITLSGLWIIQPVIIIIVKTVLYFAPFNSNTTLLIGKLIATCVTLVWNYLLYKKFVFTSEDK